jgi:hypothetical protein
MILLPSATTFPVLMRKNLETVKGNISIEHVNEMILH